MTSAWRNDLRNLLIGLINMQLHRRLVGTSIPLQMTSIYDHWSFTQRLYQIRSQLQTSNEID